MQYIINQNTFFISVKWAIHKENGKYPSRDTLRYYTRIIRKYFNDLHKKPISNIRMKNKEGFFYLYDLANKTERLESYKGLDDKPHYFIVNHGVIAEFKWMGSILDIEQATKILHLKMRELKRKYSIIGELNIFIAGNDYQYNTIDNKEIVKDDIN